MNVSLKEDIYWKSALTLPHCTVYIWKLCYGIGVVIWVEAASKIYIFPFCLQEGLSSSADAMLLLREMHDVGL